MSNLGPRVLLFQQTASVTVASTAAETTVTGAGVGSLTLPANFLSVGSTLRIEAMGFYSDLTPTLEWKVKLGATTVLDTGANSAPNNITSRFWQLEAMITVRSVGAPGTVIGQGTVRYATSHTADSADDFGPSTTTTNITTTGALTIDVTAQWGTSSGSNTLTCTNLAVWVDRPIS